MSLDLISPPLGELPLPHAGKVLGRERKERGSKPAERCEVQEGGLQLGRNHPGTGGILGLMWPQNLSFMPREWGSGTPRLSLHALNPLSESYFEGNL